MKVRGLFLIFVCLGLAMASQCTSLCAQSQSQKMNQEFVLYESTDSLSVFADAPVTFRKSPGSKILVEISVELENAGPNIMLVLTRSNRYKLQETRIGSILLLSRTKDIPSISVAGQPLIERVSYKIYLPRPFWGLIPKYNRS